MNLEIERIINSPPYQKTVTALKSDHKVSLSNLTEGLKGFLSCLIFQHFKRNILYISEKPFRPELFPSALVEPQAVCAFPEESLHAYFAEEQSPEAAQTRIATTQRLTAGDKTIVVASIKALLTKIQPPDKTLSRFTEIEAGMVMEMEALITLLTDNGYARCARVASKGQFAVRGGIIDVFPVTSPHPFRLDFFDNEIESIKVFDPETQRSAVETAAFTLAPARETILDSSERQKALTIFEQQFSEKGKNAYYDQVMEDIDNDPASHDDMLAALLPAQNSLLQYLDDCIVILDEPEMIEETGKSFLEKTLSEITLMAEGDTAMLTAREHYLDYETFMSAIEKHPLISWSMFTLKATGNFPAVDFHSKKTDDFLAAGRSAGNYAYLKQVLGNKIADGNHYILCCHNEKSAEKAAAFFKEQMPDINPADIRFVAADLTEGFELPSAGVGYIAEAEIFGKKETPKKRRAAKGKKIASFADLTIGEYVVHDAQGIGIYRGIEQMEVGGMIKDLMVIEYAGNDRFYLPVEQMDAVQVYIGSDVKPAIHRLGDTAWQKAKSRAKRSVEDMADELIALYAKRRMTQGIAFGKDTVWQQDFENAFPYQETEDQLRSIDEIKSDMEKAVPMDRLLCGDVGYGKTEVALRAAFKAVMDSKQVAILVPTTILAQQHYETITERFKDFPVTIALMSRFRTPAQQKATVAALEEGRVDILVGTHRLLSKDIRFKDLGLLIVDEEQRFGVKSKEKIKTLKENVDVLTLSATPIPRTLHMSMSGIRDMSVIEEPPVGRKPVQTFVMRYNPVIIAEAIGRELSRGGQVYYIHNRVRDIAEVTEQVREMVPNARIVTAHGQMTGSQLEKIMKDFLEKRYDILVTTTIVESGMDVSNANTMIVDQGDCFGLSQLYQLRGRVGRSERQAYCYITYRRQEITETAQKRLQAIRDFTAFGSGFKIAMRDLEIRGAGNILGAEQAGHFYHIGYEMYCRILEETIQSKLEGREAAAVDLPVKITLHADAYLPDRYISDETLKFDIYQKIAYLKSQKDRLDLIDELTDRFGKIPESVHNLMMLSLIKYAASRRNITEIRQVRSEIRFYFESPEKMPLPDPKIIYRLYENFGFKLKAAKSLENVWSIALKSDQSRRQLEEILAFLEMV